MAQPTSADDVGSQNPADAQQDVAAPTALGETAPGLEAPRPAGLAEELRSAFAAKDDRYVPRTHLLTPEGGPRHLNRLILETSPYLVQHAHNPVDWRPWGPEALAAAQDSDKPIFLSVGYATCHWCHVMEEESFDAEDVAEILNRDFIVIKVDREQRPDVDQTYMLATMLLTRQGGWPNSVWMTPSGKPFHAASYLPKSAFIETLQAVSEAWRNQRPQINDQSERLTEAIRTYSAGVAQSAAVNEATHSQAVAELAQFHNEMEGGFSVAPQFPHEVYLLYLTDMWRRAGDPRARDIAVRTLSAIEAGGIHDQIGGGFHRYAVDPNWRTPHFEKMLYNQGLLGLAFVEAWEAFGHPRFERAARRTFDYVLRDMRDPDGAFYAAEDADSTGLSGTEFEGERTEGAFYTWTPDQARTALGDDTDRVATILGLDQPATIESGPIAHLDPDAATDFETLDPLLEKLRKAREARPRPLRDEKVIAGWNGLMIRALAAGGMVLGEPGYVAAAASAAEAIWARLWDGERLKRLYADGKTSDIDGGLDDHAWLGVGFIALFDATQDPTWLQRAAQLSDQIMQRFPDRNGRLRMAAEDGPLGPAYENEDGATPAGESSALELFAALALRTQGLEQRSRAEVLLGAISGSLAARPVDRTTALRGALLLRHGDSRPFRWLSSGRVRVEMTRKGRDLKAEIRIADGWHLNAHQQTDQDLIGVSLTGEAVEEAEYPAAVSRTLGFQDAPIQVLEGRQKITAQLAEDGPALVMLTVQACSDEICLAPEDAVFRLR
ncbi:MAG: DUF255 domain-containing protein [Pseudomonadota bacterium]